MKTKWQYKPGGNCPVQSEGEFLGYHFYFRSRWKTATIVFIKSEDDHERYSSTNNNIFYRLWETEPYGAGWLSQRFSRWLIRYACLKIFIKTYFNY